MRRLRLGVIVIALIAVLDACSSGSTSLPSACAVLSANDLRSSGLSVPSHGQQSRADNPSYASVCVYGRVSVFRMNQHATGNYQELVDGPGHARQIPIPRARAALVVDPPLQTLLVQWKNELVQVNALSPISSPTALARTIDSRLEQLARR